MCSDPRTVRDLAMKRLLAGAVVCVLLSACGQEQMLAGFSGTPSPAVEATEDRSTPPSSPATTPAVEEGPFPSPTPDGPAMGGLYCGERLADAADYGLHTALTFEGHRRGGEPEGSLTIRNDNEQPIRLQAGKGPVKLEALAIGADDRFITSFGVSTTEGTPPFTLEAGEAITGPVYSRTRRCDGRTLDDTLPPGTYRFAVVLEIVDDTGRIRAEVMSEPAEGQVVAG